MNSAALESASRLPSDVRWMNLTAAVLALAVVLAFAGLGVTKVLRHPAFSLRAIAIEGDVGHISEAVIRAHALQQMNGTFFTLSLARVQQAFEGLPWVRKAVVQRVWPWRLKVRIEEHRPAAIWAPDENTEELVNTFGEVFDASVADVEGMDLPVFSGAAANSGQILRMYHALRPLLQPLGSRIAWVSLSGRGSWQLELQGGSRLELGRGSDEEILKRTQAFLSTLPWVAPSATPRLLSADLRHREGYALRLQEPAPASGTVTDAR
jgi:cell division protein FtsQ